ncbi:MAG: lytic transglycosylase domain-containing protein, partial [Actinomycetota bacterium]|nr:lytic transglycosylase domain-containing protein [Actinomycetota bacterium]
GNAAAGTSDTAAPPQAPPGSPPLGAPAAAGTGAGDAASVAASLEAAERTIRDPATPAADLEKAGRAQQDAYRLLVDRPEWTPQVLSAVPSPLRPTVQANVTAGAELRALNKARTSLPLWRIVAPAPAQELLAHYKAAEADLGVPWEYLAAIHLVETRMGRIRGTSSAGAQGPMQFLPATWSRYGKGGDINSNRDAIFGAARLLAANGGPRDMSNALYRYNPTPRYVKAVTAYATEMQGNERAYYGYYHWQVYYRLVDGDRLLPVGYGS